MFNKIQDAIRLVERGEVEKGITVLKEAEREASDAEKFEIAELYQNWGHMDHAMTLFKELLNKFPGEGELLVALAECCLDEAMDEDAIRYLEMVGRHDNEFLRALILQADLYEAQGLTEVAERKLSLALEKDKKHPVLAYALADFYLRHGKFHSSLPLFETARKGDAEIEDLSLRYAEALSRAGKFEDALVQYRQGLEHHKELYSLFGYGFTAFKASEYKEAIAALEELKDMDPDYSTLYPVLSEAYEEEGAVKEAYEVIQDGLKRDEHNENIYLQAARLAYKLHQPEQGEAWIGQALAINPSQIEPLVRLGDQYLKEERYEDIISLYKPLVEMDEEIPLMFWHLAASYKETEQFEKAQSWYEKADQEFREDPLFVEEYAYFLLEEGMHEKAKEKFLSLLKLSPDRTDIEDVISRMEDF